MNVRSPYLPFCSLSIACLVTAGWLLPRSASGEVFLLENGGSVEGELVESQQPGGPYLVRLPNGGEITLDRAQVREVVRRRPEEIEYEKIRPTYPDTVEGQWELAEWCREHRLSELRRRHLERVIELDTDHASARRALGYSKLEGGKWQTQEEIMTSRGYVLYKGDWVLPQEIELRERKQKDDRAEKDWRGRLKRWREWLANERAQEAVAQINQINDPYAVKALAEAVAEEPLELHRKLFIRALARIGTPQAWQVLAIRSLEDPIEEVRLTCLDYLEAEPQPAAVKFFISKLRSKDNVVVNRAAVALARMRDPTAIGPLIDALVTTHKFRIQTGQQGGYSATFSPDGQVNGFGVGGGPKIITQRMQNAAVLDALVLITEGISFNYDVKAWKSWLATQKRPASINARRD